MVRFILGVKAVYDKFSRDEMTVYAAQVTFFIILSAVPFIMLLLTVIQMIPSVSNADLLELVVSLTPVDYKSLAFRAVNDLSLKSPATMMSVTAVMALWSSGRGMFSVARGLDRVHGREGKRSYVISRLICSGYTIVFILVCVMSLGLLVFGRTIQAFLEARLPVIAEVTGHIINFRAIWAALVPLTVVFLRLLRLLTLSGGELIEPVDRDVGLLPAVGGQRREPAVPGPAHDAAVRDEIHRVLEVGGNIFPVLIIGAGSTVNVGAQQAGGLAEHGGGLLPGD